jgi:hypothetical protein
MAGTTILPESSKGKKKISMGYADQGNAVKEYGQALP